MNMSFPSREQVASIRKNYPLGTRVMLNNIGNRMYCDRFYKESCNTCGSKLICNGCSNCGKCK